jgi:hypothetical protein
VPALAAFIGAVGRLPSLYSDLGAVAGVTHRVAQLFEALEQLVVGASGYCTTRQGQARQPASDPAPAFRVCSSALRRPQTATSLVSPAWSPALGWAWLV